jgi:DNA primase
MAGLIPQYFIDELLTRVDIVEVVGDRVSLKRSGNNHHARCPFHNERTPSFTVSSTKQFYHCFGCGAHGTAIRFLMEYDGMEFREAVAYLADLAGLSIPEEAREAGPAEDHQGVYRVLSRAAELYRGWLRRDGQRAVDYLKGRGISGETAQRYALGFAPPGWENLIRSVDDPSALKAAGLVVDRGDGRVYDRFRDRLMFPIRDRRGRVIAFGGRVLGDGEPKYLNSPETAVFQKGHELYGLYELLQRERKPEAVVVVEGYMDVIALAEAGVNYAVATLGTATSVRQVERLFRVTKDVVFCFDGDEAGRQAAWRALENVLPAMREGRQARFLFLPEGDDPDSLVGRAGRSGFEQAMADAQTLSDYLVARLSEQIDLTNMDGRARLLDHALPLLRRLPADIYRHMLIERIAGMGRVGTEYLEGVVDGQERDASRERPTATATRREPAVRRTSVRLAIALLLQQPSLASEVDDPAQLREIDLPGVGLLAEMVEIARKQPNIPGGALLERFRGSEHESALWRLATWDHMVPESGQQAEFQDALARLEALRRDQRLQHLYDRLQQGDINNEELAEWNRLLQGSTR